MLYYISFAHPLCMYIYMYIFMLSHIWVYLVLHWHKLLEKCSLIFQTAKGPGRQFAKARPRSLIHHVAMWTGDILCVWAVEHPHQSDMWEHQGRDLKAGKHGKKSPKDFIQMMKRQTFSFWGIFFWGFLRHLLTLSPEKSDRTTVEGGQSQAVTSCCRSNLCQTP